MQLLIVGKARSSVIALALILAASPAFAQTREPARPPVEADDGLKAGSVAVPAPPSSAQLPAIEPVIPDADFNAAIPALDPAGDPALEGPLESIEAFERRIAAEQAGAKPAEGAAAPLGDPALADRDAVEEVGDAPVRDAELAQPLPPLGSFQVEPVQFTEAEEDDEAAKVAYRIRVNGLEPADKASEAAMADLFKDLSALHDGDGKAANAAMLSARLTDDSVLMQKILASEGWYDARVTTRIDRSGEDPKAPLDAVIDVVPGKRFTLSAIDVKADPTVPPTLIVDNLAVKVGEPIVAERIQGAEAQIALKLPENGYPFAEVGQRDILLDQVTADGVYTLPVTVGPRARFGDVATDGDLAFDAKHAGVLARFKRGELYDSRKVDDLRQALVATGLFSTVSVEATRTGADAGDGTEYVTMMVHQDAGPPRTIAGSAGYGTGEGLRAEASWTHRNLFRPEGALIARGVAGTKEQGAGVTFRRSNAGKRDRTFEIVAEALHSDFEAFSAYTGRLGVRMAYDSTPIWQKKMTWALGAEVLATAEEDYSFAKAANTRRTFFVAGLSGQLGLDLTDSLLDPTKGFRVTTLIQPEGSLRNGFTPYVRARMDASAYYPFGDSLVVAGRVRFGTIQGAKLFDLAPSRRLYSGGGGSVRGFGYLKLGPKDPNGDPLGGRSLNEAAAEVRYRFGNYGVVGFVDVGQSYAATTPQFSDLRVGVGLGGRFYTNFGPIRLDVATPLARRKGEGRFNLYVSIGQAF